MKKPLHFALKAKDIQPKGSLKFMLHYSLTGPEKERPLSRMHASNLTKDDGICPRYYALHDVTNTKPKDQWLTAADLLTYKMGTDLQDTVVNYFADMGKAVGHWKCSSCEKVQQFCTRPAKCSSCGCKHFTPEEVRFKSALTDASCGLDMLVNIGQPKLRIVELKTMIKTQFEGLKAPLAEHRLRTNLYLRIVEESGHPWANFIDTTKAKVLYVCKGGYLADPELAKWGLSDYYSPFKEYDITRMDKATDEMSHRAKVVKDFRADLVPMPCGVCATAMTKRAQTCSMRKTCFSGDYPPEYDWNGK